MGVAIIDLLPTRARVRDMVQSWVSSELVDPVAWGRHRIEADGGHFEWELMATSIEPAALERNEILNRLGNREDLRLVVIAGPLASDDWLVVRRSVEQLREELEVGFGADDRGGTLLMLVPPRPDDGDNFIHEDFVNLCGPWSQTVIVSPEDSPSPHLGIELGDRSLDAPVAHVLAGITRSWKLQDTVDIESPTTRALTADARLVRCWTHVIDGGYLVDHVGTKLGEVKFVPEETFAQGMKSAMGDLLKLPEVVADFESDPPKKVEIEQPEGWRYIVGFLRYAIRRFIPELVKGILEKIVEPVARFVERLIDTVAKMLGAPQRKRAEEVGAPAVDAVQKSAEAARSVLARLDGNVELDDPPAPASSLWRRVTGFVLQAIDEQRLDVQGAIGPAPDESHPYVLQQLAQQYDAKIADARQQLLDALGSRGLPEVLDPIPEPARFRRRWIKIAGILLVVAGVVMLCLGLAFPALGLFLLAATSIVATGLITMILRTIVRLASAFRNRFRSHDDASRAVATIEFWTASLVKWTYRRSQLDSWIRALRAFIDGAGAGPPLGEDEQRPFTPGVAPRALQFATGLVDPARIKELATAVRSAVDEKAYFGSVWTRLLSHHPMVFVDAHRHPSDGPLADLLRIEHTGLDLETRQVSRELIESKVAELAPDELLTSVVVWPRSPNRFGVETIAPPPGVEPLGPVGRGYSTDEGEIERGRQMIADCTAIVLDGENRPIGLAAHLGSDGRQILTSTALVAGLGGATVGPDAADHIVPIDARLAGAMIATSSKSISLAGLTTLRVGRGVAVASLDGATIRFETATIGLVGEDGTFRLDRAASLGSPVVDGLRGTLLGIVVAQNPTVAVGPTLIRPALCSHGVQMSSNPKNEVDVGIRIPKDVLVEPRAATTGAPEPTSTGPQRRKPSEFLKEILTPRLDAFEPALFRDYQLDKVTVDVCVPQLPFRGRTLTRRRRDGRLMLSSQRIQLSAPLPLSTFSFVRAAPTAAQPDPQPTGETNVEPASEGDL